MALPTASPSTAQIDSEVQQAASAIASLVLTEAADGVQNVDAQSPAHADIEMKQAASAIVAAAVAEANRASLAMPVLALDDAEVQQAATSIVAAAVAQATTASSAVVQDETPHMCWEVETDLGWLRWHPRVEFRGEAGEVVPFRLGMHQYEAVFRSSDAGEQINTLTGTSRVLRRVVSPEGEGDGRTEDNASTEAFLVLFNMAMQEALAPGHGHGHGIFGDPAMQVMQGTVTAKGKGKGKGKFGRDADYVDKSDGARFVAWVSVDPRSGTLQVYPGNAGCLIEAAHQRGDRNIDLGEAFFHAIVHLEGAPLQRTARGRRDVRRISLDAPDGGTATECGLFVVQNSRAWVVALSPDTPGAREQRVRVPRDSAVEVAKAAELAQRGFAEESDEADAEDTEGRVALWEWCHKLGVTPATAQLPPKDDWGVYSEALNILVEQSFVAREASVQVVVGVRTYRILFGPKHGFAKQIDDEHKKQRLVRRRMVDPEERARKLQPVAPSVARGESACPICYEEFADTAHMPIVELTGCRHTFHTACAQQLADEHQDCPCCRQPVDWLAQPSISCRHR